MAGALKEPVLTSLPQTSLGKKAEPQFVGLCPGIRSLT